MEFTGLPAEMTTTESGSSPRILRLILLGVDQGAIITVNGGQTWSSWYNQPTAQFYHVITDNRVPYWVYGRAAGKWIGCGNQPRRSRRDFISRLSSSRVEEYGYVAPDPLHPI
jgi:hypothetical protein